MKKALGLKKKHFIILIVSLCAVALIAEGILLAHTFADKEDKDKKTSKATATPTIDSEEEALRESLDEEAAEEVRHCIEIALAPIETYDEMEAALGDAADYVKVFSLINAGLQYYRDLPAMHKVLTDVYADKLDKGDFFKSEKYKNSEYIITVKLPEKPKDAMTVKGTWKEK